VTRTMVDSTDANALPAGTTMGAGYLDGRWPSYAPMVRRFPTAVHVAIVVSPIDDGDVADVENGDLTPAQLPEWVQERRAAIDRPCGYCNRDNLDAVDLALFAAGIPVHAAVLWVATLDGTVVSGLSRHGYAIVACQNRSAAMNAGDYDSSLVFDDTWMPSPAPPTSYPSTPLQGGGMLRAILITTDPAGNGWDNQFRQRSIPWPAVTGGPFLNGTDPDVAADDRYPRSGTVRAQQRDGLALVEVIGCEPNTTQLVFLPTSS